MATTRVFVGRLPYRATENDLRRLFRGCGSVQAVLLKRGYGFVDMADARDAAHAVHQLDGTELMGMKITVELAKGTPHGRDRGAAAGGSGRPQRTSYRLIVANLSSRISWQDLKDCFRPAAEPVYAEAHSQRRNEGCARRASEQATCTAPFSIVEFANKGDMLSALDRMDGTQLNGRKIRVREAKKRSRSHSCSGSGSGSQSPDGPKRVKRSRSLPTETRRSRSLNGH